MKFYSIVLFSLLLNTKNVIAQALGESTIWPKKTISEETHFRKILIKGKWQGNVRNYMSVTLNQGELTDFYANGLALGIRYQTAAFHGFQFIVSGALVKNLFSSNLTAKDPLSNTASRYELGLYDLENNSYKSFYYRLEEANLSYVKEKFKLTIGNQYLQTPLLNVQDGRLRASIFSGVWANYSFPKNIQLAGGWLPFASPRSSFDWLRIDKAIGINSQGVNASGTVNTYKNNLSSAGFFVLGSKASISKRIQIQLWDFLLENISNSIYLKSKFQLNTNNEKPFSISTQLMAQQGVNFRKTNTYTPEKFNSISWGLQATKTLKNWEHSFAFNRIENLGEFLSPREFGRDPFFTFMNRERLEGIANSWALVLGSKYYTKTFSCELKSGYFRLPSPTDFVHNKYGLPSYWHTNLNVNYSLPGKVNDLKIGALISYKKQLPQETIAWKYIANKVNLWQINLVLNYTF